jgi:ABC-type branched-subunit amino acid transport system substrate-binding protein
LHLRPSTQGRIGDDMTTQRSLARWARTLGFSAILLALGPPARADDGVTKGEVVLGMCNALTGPASALGLGMKKGASVYFDKVNAAGGVHGRKIRLVSVDDGYEPKNTIERTKALIEKDRVFALFGYVGTPTSSAVLPMVTEAKIPFWGPFTGAELLRTPVNRWVFNVRGSYNDEAELQVATLVERMKLKRVAILYQNDAYGMAVRAGVLKALKKRGLEPVAEATYERNTVDVDGALAALQRAKPDAVSMVGTYKAMAAFIRKARAGGFSPVFLNVSFVGTAALVNELAGAGEDVLITQVMPSPWDSAIPIVTQYRADMKAAGHLELDYTDLEGYVAAAVFVEALRKAGPALTRDGFVAAAESLKMELGGLQVAFSPAHHSALDDVFLTRIANNRVVRFR